jgi:hypothetical protein
MGYMARRGDAEWSLHSKELQHRHVLHKPCNPPRSGLIRWVSAGTMKKFIGVMMLYIKTSGQLGFLGSTIQQSERRSNETCG